MLCVVNRLSAAMVFVLSNVMLQDLLCLKTFSKTFYAHFGYYELKPSENVFV